MANWPTAAAPKKNRKLEVVHLMAGECCAQSFFEKLTTSGGNQVRQFASEQVFLRIAASFVATFVGVADEPRRVGHEDHALRGVKDLVVEIALALQFGLDSSSAR